MLLVHDTNTAFNPSLFGPITLWKHGGLLPGFLLKAAAEELPASTIARLHDGGLSSKYISVDDYALIGAM